MVTGAGRARLVLNGADEGFEGHDLEGAAVGE
jgi:hypothetical protein